MPYEELQTQIMYRFMRCNEMTAKQAEDYAWIAVHEMKHSLPMLHYHEEVIKEAA